MIGQQATHSVLQRREGRSGQRALNRRLVRANPLLEPEKVFRTVNPSKGMMEPEISSQLAAPSAPPSAY